MDFIDEIEFEFVETAQSIIDPIDSLEANNQRESQVVVCESVDKTTILNELQLLRNQFHQSEAENQKILNRCQSKIKTLRNQLNELHDNTNNLFKFYLPTLPFDSELKYMEYEEKLAKDQKSKRNLRHFIKRITANDYKSFVRKAIKTFIPDELAINFCWRGTSSKPSVQNFILITTIKDITLSRYTESTEKKINRIIQQHFIHANDRLKTKQKSLT